MHSALPCVSESNNRRESIDSKSTSYVIRFSQIYILSDNIPIIPKINCKSLWDIDQN